MLFQANVHAAAVYGYRATATASIFCSCGHMTVSEVVTFLLL